MAKFLGFSPTQQTVVTKIYRDCRVILENAHAKAGTEGWRNVFTQIMGSASGPALKSAEQALEETIKVMFMRIGGQSFDVTYEATFTNTNADMLSVGHAVSGGGASHTTFVDEARQQGAVSSRLPMRLGPNFFAMDDRNLFEQSKVETFLHELSHHSVGSIDDSNGGECYGWTGVTRLKGLGPARAVWNAENIGFFLTWLG
ncbi:MAG: hypothetical protein KGL43_17485 [Burkholderiales bacterium]|nr:hypothetical protein [Burkholderiales bacterium]MDE2395810.1 hypothetical protein [Burkholderiales bacterium]MDE2455383.1 hypothetical protein [Burkholderiales bacterium]